jgi:hypothetical protein
MQLTLPRSDRHNQVLITMVHPEWTTTSTLDDSHPTMELTAPEGIDINDVEVFAHFVGPDGKPDPNELPQLLKGKIAHVEQTNDAGKSGEPDADEHGGDVERPEDTDADAAAVEGAADAGRVGEAEVEQDSDEIDEPNSTHPMTHEHHKSRRPRHAS